MRLFSHITTERHLIAFRDRVLRLSLRFAETLQSLDKVIGVIAFFASIGLLVCLLAHIGYNESELNPKRLLGFVHAVQGVFTASILASAAARLSNREAKIRKGMVILDILVISTLITVFYPRPVHPWIPLLEHIFYSDIYLYGILGCYAIVSISDGVSHLIGKRTNPALMLSGSFIIFIIIGSLVLMLPRCTTGGISYVDALFVSTSAVCITGLTPVDVATTFTPTGLVVLSLLIQTGGLGVLTFTCFFSLFFTGSSSIFNQLMLKDMIYSKSMSTLIPTLVYTLVFTLVIEAIGTVGIFLSIHDTLGLTVGEEIGMSAFHSLSAFCNAGFSNLPGGLSNPNLLYGNQAIYWVASVLIVGGSLGFPLLVNFKEVIANFLRRHWLILRGKNPGNRMAHYYSMNSKIVLSTFGILLGAGAIIFFIWEYDNTLRGMTMWQKISQSVFNSAVPRSAGFSSVNPASFMTTTLIVIMFLMWIGGGSQSTGGGIKVNTFAAILLNLRAYIMGIERPTAFRRTIAYASIRRANAVVALSILTYFAFSFAIISLEPDLPPRDLLFETLSALFTVGSSLGVTSSLSDASKIVLCVAMFLGRIGMISLLIGIKGRDPDNRVHYPDDNIIIT